VQDSVGASVRLEQVRDDEQRETVVVLRGRPRAFGPAVESHDLGLVHGAPPVDLPAVLARAKADESREVVDRFAVLETAALGDPRGEREVEQRDDRREPPARERGEDRVVMGDRFRVDSAWDGSMRLHSSDSRCALCPSDSASAKSES
jgi:hypothetical protein